MSQDWPTQSSMFWMPATLYQHSSIEALQHDTQEQRRREEQKGRPQPRPPVESIQSRAAAAAVRSLPPAAAPASAGLALGRWSESLGDQWRAASFLQTQLAIQMVKIIELTVRERGREREREMERERDAFIFISIGDVPPKTPLAFSLGHWRVNSVVLRSKPLCPLRSRNQAVACRATEFPQPICHRWVKMQQRMGA